MGVQKFDEFCSNKKIAKIKTSTKKVDTVKTGHDIDMPQPKKISPKVLKQIQTTGKIPAPKYSKYRDVGPRAENVEIKFNGKIVQLPDNTKPSVNFKLLEDKMVSKEKLHYMVNKQNDNSIVIVKYNEKADVMLKDFVLELVNYYRKNKVLEEFLQDIIIEGNDTFSIVKNIPNVDYKEQPLIDVITNDLMKLLK